jgi:outer membrane protein assembly factor BamB
MNHRTALISMLVTASAATLAPAMSGAEDWPQWRGPSGTGISAEKGWVSQPGNLSLWKASVGHGYASVVVADGRLFTSGHNVDAGQDTIFCLDAVTGKEIWKHSYPAELHNKFHEGGTLGTPTIDGDRVFVLDREGRFFCFNAADGTIVWKHDLNEQHTLEFPEWMFSASPLALGDSIVINVGPLLVCDKATGKTKWKTRDTGHAYSTPVAFEHEGRSLFAVFNGEGLVVFDAGDGKELASHPWKTQYDVNAATPIVLDDGRIFISSGYNHGCAMLRFNGDSLDVLWENKEMRNQMSGCVLVGDHLYGFDDATLKCIDLEGNVKWSKRGLGLGALMVADNRLIINSARGELVIAEASPAAYTELSNNKVLEGGKYWTSPVLSNGLIYCRNSRGDIVAVDCRTGDAAP